MSGGVGLVAGASIVWIDFLMPFKTHQEKSPRSGILSDFLRRGLTPIFDRQLPAFDSSTLDEAAVDCKTGSTVQDFEPRLEDRCNPSNRHLRISPFSIAVRQKRCPTRGHGRPC